MNGNRKSIDIIADLTRSALGLNAPIDLDTLLRVIEEKLQGRCIAVDITELDVDAEISTEDESNNFVIRFRGDKPKTRVLFSIAHELGHLFFDFLQPDGSLRQLSVRQRNMESSINESIANEYAAAFLMPENEFIIKCKECMNDNKVNITKVAKYFGVSIQAATVRGNVLGLW